MKTISCVGQHGSRGCVWGGRGGECLKGRHAGSENMERNLREEQRAAAQKEEKTTQHTLKTKSQQWTKLVREQGATEGGGEAATSPYLRQSDGIIIWISASRRIVLAWRWLSAVTSAPCHANKSRLDGDQEIRCSTGAGGGGGGGSRGPQQNEIQSNYGSAAKISNQPHLYPPGEKCICGLKNVKVMLDEKHFRGTWSRDECLMAGEAQIAKAREKKGFCSCFLLLWRRSSVVVKTAPTEAFLSRLETIKMETRPRLLGFETKNFVVYQPESMHWLTSSTPRWPENLHSHIKQHQTKLNKTTSVFEIQQQHHFLARSVLTVIFNTLLLCQLFRTI